MSHLSEVTQPVTVGAVFVVLFCFLLFVCMPFIGLTSMTSRGYGQGSPICSGPHLPSPGSSELTPRGEECLRGAGVGRARIKKQVWDLKGAQSDVKTQGYQTIQIRRPKGKAEPISWHRQMGGVRRKSCHRGFLLCPFCHQHLQCPQLSSCCVPGRIFFLSQSFNFFLLLFSVSVTAGCKFPSWTEE